MLPTSATDGIIEYVPSVSLARVLAEHRTITRFLQIHHPDASGEASLFVTCASGNFSIGSVRQHESSSLADAAQHSIMSRCESCAATTGY